MRYIVTICLSTLLSGCMPGYPNPGLISSQSGWYILSDEEIMDSLNEVPIISSERDSNVGSTFVCCEDSFATR